MASNDSRVQSPNKESEAHPNEKHLEFIQSNIGRMSQCSFQMKGWSITITSALIAVFVSTASNETPGNRIYLLAAAGTTLLFWLMDSFYLSKERKFIGMYNDLIGVGNGKNQSVVQIREYEIPVNEYKGWRYCILRAMVSPSEILLYGSIIAGLILLYCIV